MDCSQILPGAVNLGPCSAATGYLNELPFICYASGSNLILLDGRLKHVQTLLGSDLGFSHSSVTCMHVAESNGQVAAAWDCDVLIFVPEKSDQTTATGEFGWSWKLSYSHSFLTKVLSLSFNQDGSQLLVGGNFISLWTSTRKQESPLSARVGGTPSPTKQRGRGSPADEGGGGFIGSDTIHDDTSTSWNESWTVTVASPIIHLKFSPDGSLFASASLNDRLVKIWYKLQPRKNKVLIYTRERSSTDPNVSSKQYSFTYIAHPRAITGFVWRKTSIYMKQSSVSNVLLTRCKDNICRLWSQTLPKEKAPQSNLLRFFLAASIDPIADIPFRSTMPVEDADFIVHWLNNKEMTYSSKANHIQQSALTVSRHQSMTSLASSANEEMLSSWVCVEEKTTDTETDDDQAASKYQSYNLGEYLGIPGGGAGRPPVLLGDVPELSKKHESQLMDEWVNSPDLLVCIHPNNGSLMVWTVEGLDSPRYSTRLVHISFSSCLPHVFPPHLAQTLHQELQQYLLKEPEPIGLLSAPLSPTTGTISPDQFSTTNASELSLPVPQIRLPSGQKVVDIPESAKTFRPESSLILLSTHRNGNVNAWSVELTVQANYCTSISGLIHCGQTGGHSQDVSAVYRHPWLPVLLTVAANKNVSEREEDELNELIIWNTNPAGPLDHKAQINELSKVLSTDPNSFTLVSWVPPISLPSSSVGALSRCPSFGLFVTNVGNELCLFQTSLYPIILANSSHTLYHTSLPLYDSSNKMISLTSHSGNEGMSFISLIDSDLDRYQEIVSLHAFRTKSAIIDAKGQDDAAGPDSESNEIKSHDFSNEVLVVLIENQKGTSPGLVTSHIHVWRIVLKERKFSSAQKPPSGSFNSWYQTLPRSSTLCQAQVTKVLSGVPLPLGGGEGVSHIIKSRAACDVASSLQLQLPSLSSPFLFLTVSSSSVINCWQFKASLNDTNDEQSFTLQLYDVFGANSPGKLCCSTHRTFEEFSLSTPLPLSLSCAYPGRFAMAHSLTQQPLSLTSETYNPLTQHVLVSVWECESSGGLQWNCESQLPLHGILLAPPTFSPGSRARTCPEVVNLDWLPMENGSYLLATCFSSVITIFGMSLTKPHQESKPSLIPLLSTGKDPEISINEKTCSSWISLLQFSLSSSLLPQWMAYTGSNSILIGIGSGIEVYTCWIESDNVGVASSDGRGLSTTGRRVLREGTLDLNSPDGELGIVNLLDYAHSKNSPLPQYHPQILSDLMTSGKLDAVKLILINLVKHLLLYQRTEKKERVSYFDEEEEEEKNADSRGRLLSVVDGKMRRSRKARVMVAAETIAPLSLSQLKIFASTDLMSESKVGGADDDDEVGGDNGINEDDDYDALFSHDIVLDYDSEFTSSDSVDTHMEYDKIDITSTDFTQELADKLASILQYTSLPDISDLDQVRLIAVADTVATTNGEGVVGGSEDLAGGTDLGTTAGAGYASVGGGLSGGIGGEGMDDCGMRYLLALQNYLTLSHTLPKGLAPLELSTSDLIWAFHSDAELELLSNVPCVRENRLNWPELMSAGVSIWLRSNDTLRKLAEKLAKAQFMSKQDPLDASLLYLAMKKQSLIKGLYRTVSDERMRSFFSNDFTQDRWRRAALKNAFALLSKQRFDHAAAFFLLAGKLWDAIDVCVNRLHDIKLAIMIARLYEGENGSCFHRLLREHILGETTPDTNTSVEMSPDPFLRSIAHWLLQDFSSSLETLLATSSQNETRLEPAIFNFYFYLRSHPLLLRSRYPLSNAPGTQTTSKPSLRKKPQLTGVGDDPLTAAERNLVFNTAYHHLSNGSPLLSLIVLNKLPKGSDLGLHDNNVHFVKSDTGSLTPTGGTSTGLDESVFSNTTIGPNVSIVSGLLGEGGEGAGDDDIDWSQPVSLQKKAEEEDDLDWSRPVASQTAPTDDDFDWSKPVSAQVEEEEEFDWSKPAMSQHRFSLLDDIELTKEVKVEEIEEEGEEEEGVAGGGASNIISCQGLFVLSLAEQLQYNALLSILTEELKTIHIPACCNHLWKTRGKEALPLLPLGCQASRRGQSMVEWFEEEPLERVLSTLQGLLVNWLRSESMIVSEVCGLEIGAGSSSVADSKSAAHAGYDLLTTLMNYVSLHSSTLPHLLSVQTELMHLMNTLLPWSTGLSHELEDTDLELGQIPSCAINPAQLPLLTSCSLPSKHPLNLALHIRLLSASVFGSLSLHSTPPISSNPLPNLDHIFELCCSLSHCLYLCLNPMRLQQDKQAEPLQSPGGPKSRKRLNSGGLLLDIFSSLDKPNTKASRWPGLEDWPSSLLSDDGKEASPLCLVLMEALTVVYTGLLSVAWSNHSIYDLLVLVANVPTQAKWTELFGGGVFTRIPDQKKNASFVRKVTSMKTLLRQSGKGGGAHEALGLFVAPKKSLLFHCLTKPEVPTSSAYHFEKEPVDDDGDSSDDEGDDDVYDGGLSSEGDGAEGQDACNPVDPDCYSWCIMNLGIVQMLQRVIRNTITLTGMEILEFITASPVLYRLLSLLDDWESFFVRKLGTHSTPSLNLFLPTENNQETRYGPALTRHKFILEPEHSPFRRDDRDSKLARRLWCYLVHQEPIRETFIRYIFYKKRVGSATPDEPPVQRILYRQPDSPVSCLCIGSSNASVFALATSKEVLEVEVPDIMSLDIMMDVDDNNTDSPQNRKKPEKSEDFIMIPSGPSSFIRRVGNYTPGHVTHSQSGCTSSILLKRSVPSVKKMSAHPTLAYYLTGGADGAIKMFEFGTPKPVSVLRAAGSGPGITQIRFTPQGNKYGITDSSGKLSLWQGIQGLNKYPYQTLHPGHTHQTIADFAFLGSSSLIATCGESPNHKNMCIWDTMMPSRSNVVHEWVCHEGGASAIVFSSIRQTLISGGKRGEICIYDVRSKAVVSKPVVHSAAVSCIVINDSDGYFITGSADGEIKVWDLSTVTELTSIQGKHTRARLFRADEGVMDMMVDSSGCLYSCGADGTVKVHSLDLPSM